MLTLLELCAFARPLREEFAFTRSYALTPLDSAFTQGTQGGG
jgi:hypothetical protein